MGGRREEVRERKKRRAYWCGLLRNIADGEVRMMAHNEIILDIEKKEKGRTRGTVADSTPLYMICAYRLQVSLTVRWAPVPLPPPVA